MKLNDINIVDVIETSRKKLNWRKMLWNSAEAFCFSMVSGIFLKFNLLGYAFGAILTLGTIDFCIFHKFMKAKRKAKKQLDYLVKYLNENGIDVNKMSLQKAKVSAKISYNVRNIVPTSCTIENVAVFEDYQQQLKALRQLRHEIIIGLPEDATIDGDYTEIVEREEEAKQLLMDKSRLWS